MLVVFRFVATVPIPGVDRRACRSCSTNQLLGLFNLFWAVALATASSIGMGVYPYITPSSSCS